MRRTTVLMFILASCGLARVSWVEPSMAAAGLQQRDVAVVQTTGSATLTGRVMSADSPSQPVRRARVTLDQTEGRVTFVTMTGDDGSFAFKLIPAGRYALQASKAAWLPAAYGATRPGRPGTSIAVADGQTVTTNLTMARGAVIAGTIRAPDGSPAVGVTVAALHDDWSSGERRLVGALGGLGQAETDDVGAYRLYGLTPGEYLIRATTLRNALAAADQPLHIVTPADETRARQLVAEGGRGPGLDATLAAPLRLVGLAPVFYPGTTRITGATVLRVAAGEVRDDVDIALQLVPVARVTGTITGADGRPPQNAFAALISAGPPGPQGIGLNGIKAAGTNADGRFEVDSVIPGDYTVFGTCCTNAWALADITVDGQNVDVPLHVQAPLSLTGTLAFDSASPPANRSGFNVSLSAIGGAAQIAALGQDSQTADGVFHFSTLPGLYRINVRAPGHDQWFVESVTLRGQDVADAGIEIRSDAGATDVVVTMTDRPSELTGTLDTASGTPATEYFVVVFPADRASWLPASRRIVEARPASDRRFSLKGLPAGSYLVAATTDVAPGDLASTDFLQSLVSASVPVSVVTGQRTVQNLRIAR